MADKVIWTAIASVRKRGAIGIFEEKKFILEMPPGKTQSRDRADFVDAWLAKFGEAWELNHLCGAIDPRRKLPIGAVLIYPTGANPHQAHIEYDGRVTALKMYHNTGSLPSNISVWNDRDNCPIISPDEIAWEGLRPS